MKKKIIFISSLFVSNIALGQLNLVPNPSFELYDTCPHSVMCLNYAVPWFEGGSSEYFNSCDYTNYVGVPINSYGYQPARTMNGYIGFLAAYDGSSYREYAEVKLKSPLDSNRNYCVSFYVSISNNCQYTTDAFGAFFSEDTVHCDTPVVVSVVPQVENIAGNFITDSLGWTRISGSFTAIGGERFLVLGNFKDWLFVDTLLLNYGVYPYAYFYIDDVSVYPCDAPVFIAEAGNNQNICLGDSVQIGDTLRSDYIYWWTPTAGLSNDSIANPMASPAVTTTYYLHQKDFKFDETIDSVTVFVYPALPDNAAGHDTLICEGGQAQLGITAGAFNYHWQFSPDLSDTAIANPTAMPLNTSTYVLTISNIGCSKTDSVTVTIESCDTAQNSLTLVNAFTPNGDGKNDLFKAKGTNIKTVHLKIINRWGQLLFEATNNDPGWDGTYKGQEVNPGVYYYVIEVTFEDGEVRNKAGAVMLVRSLK